MRGITYQSIRIGVTSFIIRNSKKVWPLFLVHIGNYSLLNGQHARKEAEAMKDLCLFLGSEKGHEPHEQEMSHVSVEILVVNDVNP
jgi:hypothetical protein